MAFVCAHGDVDIRPALLVVSEWGPEDSPPACAFELQRSNTALTTHHVSLQVGALLHATNTKTVGGRSCLRDSWECRKCGKANMQDRAVLIVTQLMAPR